MLKLIAVAVSCALIAGCGVIRRAPTQAQELGIQRVLPTEREAHRPAVGDRAVAAVGTSIISHSRELLNDALQVQGPVNVDAEWGEGESYRFSLPGGLHALTSRDRLGNLYFGAGGTTLTWYYKGKPGSKAAVLVDYKLAPDGKLTAIWIYHRDTEFYEAPLPAVQFTRTTTPPASTPTSFRRELLYTGRAGNTLTLMYREFSNDMARPAFTQQLQYDLGADSIIGYQGARFRVISADNTSITYEVISPLPAR